MIERLTRGIDRSNAVIGRGAAWLALIMVLLGAYNALARDLGTRIGRWTDHGVEVRLTSNAVVEWQWYLFGLLFLFGAPWALAQSAHVRVDLIHGRLGARARAWVDLAGFALFVIPFAVWAAWLAVPFAAASVRQGEISNDPHGLLRWPLKCALPVAFALLALQGVSEVGKTVLRLRALRGEAADTGEAPQ